jgi:LPXTG-motif cell wall-anchored protein
VEIRPRPRQHRTSQTVAAAISAGLLVAAGLGVLASPAGAADGGAVPSSEDADHSCEEGADEGLATEAGGDAWTGVELDEETTAPDCDDEGDDRGAELDAICPENPDLEGCTQIGQAVTILNEGQAIELEGEDRPTVLDDVATASMTLDRPATEVGGQVTHRDAVAVTTDIRALVVETPAPQLPRTGIEHGAAVAAGLGLILLGAALLRLGGRTPQPLGA